MGYVARYIIKRVLLAVLTVFIICAITFFLMHAVPGGPFNREKALSEATIQALNERYNLDKPKLEQFYLYMKNLLHGDLRLAEKRAGRSRRSLGRPSPYRRSWGSKPWPWP